MGYTKPYLYPGQTVADRFRDDASGYVSRHSFLACKFDEATKCDRCGFPACDNFGDMNLCLECRDDWWDYPKPEDFTYKKARRETVAKFLATQKGSIPCHHSPGHSW